LVIKADGLAAGKGVVVAQNKQEAITAAHDALVKNLFGANQSIVVEEFLEGQEVTFLVLTDGIHAIPFTTAQDHKRRNDGDQGPNTGGMGAYSPVPFISDELHDRIMHEIIEPTIAGMRQEGAPYIGFLYAGLMISPDGQPKVLEYNCRLGDPEAQPMLMRLKSDLIDLCDATLNKKLDTMQIDWDEQVALGVVLTSAHYPDEGCFGESIQGLDTIHDEQVKVFHAATAIHDGMIVTNGGRILCVTALAENVALAQKKAYKAVRTISWPTMGFRTDIGCKALSW
jgi:phosphoribosylamine---glycine ligase